MEGSLITAEIENIAAGGEGVASAGGRKVFIELTAPGDMVRARISGEHVNWARAELVEVLEPSPLRTAPLCPLYGSCGGCSFQHLAYEAQLEAKNSILKDAFVRIGKLTPPEPAVIPSPPWEYRNRVQLHRSPEGPGFKGRRSGAVIAAADCPVADKGIREALKEGKPRPPPDKDRFTVYSRDGVFLSEGGRSRGKTRLLHRDIILDAGLFFQSNGIMLEKLIGELVKTAGEASGRGADIYSGVGTFALFLADGLEGLDLVEENRKALALARENLTGKGIAFFAMKDEDWAKMKKRSGNGEYGFVSADPPRRGLSPGLRSWLAAAGPPLFVYVSCDPVSMARDSGELVKEYDLESLRLYDFYPQTAHIETMGVFRRKRGARLA